MFRPDPTPAPSVLPSFRPSRQPSMPFSFTHAPLAPTAKPVLNPALHQTYSPTVMPTNNESAIVAHAKADESFVKKNMWWIILLIVAVVLLIVIGCLGYRKKRKRQKDMKEAAVQKQKSREKSTREALNSDFQTGPAPAAPLPTANNKTAASSHGKPPLPSKESSRRTGVGGAQRYRSPGTTQAQPQDDHINFGIGPGQSTAPAPATGQAGLTRTKATSGRPKPPAARTSAAPLPPTSPRPGLNSAPVPYGAAPSLYRPPSQQTVATAMSRSSSPGRW
jgi:hypothetical protein